MAQRGVSFSDEEPSVHEYEQTELPPEIAGTKSREQSQETKDWFMDVMSVSMGIRQQVKVLEDVSLEGIVRYIAEGKCSKIMTMAGAGISTSAGIPDYRSPGTGLMDIMKEKYPNLQDVTDLFNIQFFLKDPKPFFERSRRFFEISLKPTPCHYFVRLLHEKGLLLRHYTQNIDTLERLAGLPGDKVVEAHGSYHTSHCMLCDQEYSFQWMEERVLKHEVVKCEEDGCTGVIKPDIVMYGESLNDRFAECHDEDTLNCDLLIIMGTALAVQPFACLTSKVKTSTPRLYINLDRGKTGKKHPMTDIMFGGSFHFDCEDNVRDVFKQTPCDDACYEIADKLGWGDELRTLVKSEHQRIDNEDRLRGKKPPQPLLNDVTETNPMSLQPDDLGGPRKKNSPKTTQPGKPSPGASPASNSNAKGGRPSESSSKAKAKDSGSNSSSSSRKEASPRSKANVTSSSSNATAAHKHKSLTQSGGGGGSTPRSTTTTTTKATAAATSVTPSTTSSSSNKPPPPAAAAATSNGGTRTATAATAHASSKGKPLGTSATKAKPVTGNIK